MARRRKRTSSSVQPRRVVLLVALGIAVLGGTFVAGFRVGQKVPEEVMPFFDTRTAEPAAPVTLVAPPDEALGDEAVGDGAPEAPEAENDPPGAAEVVDVPSTVVLQRDVPRDDAPAASDRRVLERVAPDEPAERRAVYVSAGGDGP